jgi:hypothetical protein
MPPVPSDGAVFIVLPAEPESGPRKNFVASSIGAS